MEEKEKLEKALLKVALGFQVAEVTEEYAEVDGELKLTKRKRTKKDVPPDIKAMQLLWTEKSEDLEGWSDEELQREKERLLAELSAVEKEAIGLKEVGQVRVQGKKAVIKTAVKKDGKPRAKPRKRVSRNKKEGEEK